VGAGKSIAGTPDLFGFFRPFDDETGDGPQFGGVGKAQIVLAAMK